jgi:hypothetical protein
LFLRKLRLPKVLNFFRKTLARDHQSHGLDE